MNTDNHEVTPEEEEAWLLLEKKQEEERKKALNHAAWLYAASYVREHASTLDTMTIREAVEAAYKAGHNEATRTKS